MVLSFDRPPSSSPIDNSINSFDTPGANRLLQRVINKLQILVLQNPFAAVYVLGVVDRWLDD